MIPFLLDNVFVASLASLFAVGFVWTLVKSGSRSVDTDTLIRYVNRQRGNVIDLRSKSDFSEGHISRALHMSASDLKDRSIDKLIDRPIILVNQNGMGLSGAVTTLLGRGAKEVYVLSGGIASWQQAQLPLVSAKYTKDKRKS